MFVLIKICYMMGLMDMSIRSILCAFVRVGTMHVSKVGSLCIRELGDEPEQQENFPMIRIQRLLHITINADHSLCVLPLCAR